MAAFEAVSRLTLQPEGRQSIIDLRTARLPFDRPPLDDYDPRQHREPKSPIKVWMAYFNLLRTVFGAGVLGMPLAISQAGIVLGPMLAMLTGLLIIHTHHMLLRCLNEISRQLKVPYISYRYGFRMALLHGPPICQCVGNCGPSIIAIFMILSQIGICTVFVLFTTDSLRDIMDWTNSKPALLALIIPYMVLEFGMKSLKIVSYVSMLGNLMNLIGLVLIFYHIFKEPHGEVITAATEALPLLFAFGTYLFNLSAVGVILSLEKALEEPKVMTKRWGVINVGLLVPTTIATVFGVLGYWSFGTMEENILRSLPFDDNSAMVSIGLYLVAIAFAYPIQCHPAIQIMLEVVKNHSPEHVPADRTLKIAEFIARPVFVMLTFLICHLVGFQGPFVAFVGNLCTTLLALVFPAMMDLSLKYPNNYGIYNVYLIKDILIIILGLVSWGFGVCLCGYLIYVRILSSYSPNESIFF